MTICSMYQKKTQNEQKQAQKKYTEAYWYRGSDKKKRRMNRNPNRHWQNSPEF